jgi:hypothetical protein
VVVSRCMRGNHLRLLTNGPHGMVTEGGLPCVDRETARWGPSVGTDHSVPGVLGQAAVGWAGRRVK